MGEKRENEMRGSQQMGTGGQTIYIAHVNPSGWRDHVRSDHDDRHICHAAEHKAGDDCEGVYE